MKVVNSPEYKIYTNPINKRKITHITQPKEKSFKGGIVDGAFNVLDKAFSILDKNAMIQVSFVDTVSTNIPRTLVDLKTGLAAAFETCRREFSGLFVNCLMPGLLVKALATVLPRSKELKGTNPAQSWANGAVIDKLKYYRISATKQSSNLLCSGVDTYNFTRLPYEYENEYFYTYIVTLYQKLFLMRLNSEFKGYSKIKEMKDEFVKFTKQIWEKEVTLSDSGSLYYTSLKRVLELDDLYNEIKNKYEIVYKDLNIEKNNKYYLILIYLLIVSLCLNFINVLLVIYYIN